MISWPLKRIRIKNKTNRKKSKKWSALTISKTSISHSYVKFNLILVKKEIEEYEENEGDKEVDSDEEEGKKGKKKR